MQLLLGSLAFIVSVASAAAHLCTAESPISVEALVFSGTRNPKLTLSASQRTTFCDALNATLSWQSQRVTSCRVLGFTGWRACSGSQCSVLRSGHEVLDRTLASALKEEHPDLPSVVLQHVSNETKRLNVKEDTEEGGEVARCDSKDMPLNLQKEASEELPGGNAADCTGPLHGSDDPNTIHYDVQNDVNGCFVTRQYDNNCYNYGNDILTNTFAQPGKGCGMYPHQKAKNTCDDIRKAAECDGLKWVGTELPTKLPEKGHYVSLHIWPATNFHWLRMDANLYWSHKPGGTAVRNTDNNGHKIKDPAQADVSPWSQHCGYMLAFPAEDNIKEAEADEIHGLAAAEGTIALIV